jgi:thiol-disulfide isomerase/thioredoxin
MSHRNIPVLAGVLLLAAASVPVQAEPTLKVGDAAPKLFVSKWLNGDAVEKFDAGTIYVVECWATWCGPCKAVIPHVSELNTKYKDKGVVIIGLNVWENDPAGVEKFVAEMGDKMNYRVAIDEGGREGKSAAAWLRAAGQNGIPCSFIVDKAGKIAWIGHPAGMAPVLAQVVEGKFDPAAQADLEQRKQAIMQKLMQAQQDGNVNALLAGIDEMAKIDPDFAARSGAFKFHVLLTHNQLDAAYKLGGELLEGAAKDDPEQLNEMSWTILTEENIERRDYKLAMKMAQRGVELTNGENAAILDTLARAYFDTGEIAKAVQYQRQAVEKADDEIKEELKQTLERYENATQIR